MRFKHALAVALVLTVCVVPVAVSAGTSVDDVSTAPLERSSTTTTETMGNGTMDDGMQNGSDDMTTTHGWTTGR